MPVRIEFSTANAAFAEGGYKEVARVLREIAAQYTDPDAKWLEIRWPTSGQVRDANGNTIGSWEASIDAEESESEIARQARQLRRLQPNTGPHLYGGKIA